MKEFSARGVIAGFVGGANNCTTCKNPTLTDSPLLSIYQWQEINHLSV